MNAFFFLASSDRQPSSLLKNNRRKLTVLWIDGRIQSSPLEQRWLETAILTATKPAPKVSGVGYESIFIIDEEEIITATSVDVGGICS